MKIIIDAMSGDNAPGEIIRGAVQAQRKLGPDVVLVGREAEIRPYISQLGGANDPHISIADAPDVIDMHDDPSTAVRRKPGASMTVALNLLKAGEGDAVVSAGNTGALLTGATLLVKRIRGIRRAAMAPVLPNGGKGTLLIDCGANVECTPEYLLQFGYMGSFYAKHMMGIGNPKVALLSNGAEDTKGTELCKASYALLQEAGAAGRLTFIGNVEGSDAFSGKADVIVTDGFTGNILLKTIEGTAKFAMGNLKRILTSSLKTKLGAMLVKGELASLKKLLDSREVGGTPFLGICRPVIKAHGNSDARAVYNAVRQAAAFVRAGVIPEIERNIEYMRIHKDKNGGAS